MLSPARKDFMETREGLATALDALKATNEDDSLAREKCQHALAVATCAANDLVTFIQNENGSLGEAERVGTNALRNRHDLCIAEFDKLDAEIAEPYNAAPAFPVSGGDLEFVRDRYEDLVGQHNDLVMTM